MENKKEDSNSKKNKKEGKKITRITSDSFINDSLSEEPFSDSLDNNEIDENLKCHICEKELDDPVEAFSYNLVHNFNGDSLEEYLFCSKKCWEEHILRESERIKIESKNKKLYNSEFRKGN